jgi:hypothetical protein
VIIASVIGLAVDRSKALVLATGVPARTVRRWRVWWVGPFAASTVFAEVCARSVGLEASKSPASFLERMIIPHLCVRISTSKFVAPKLVQAIAKGLPKPRAEAFKKAAACTAR